jgi:hypothetical protein
MHKRNLFAELLQLYGAAIALGVVAVLPAFYFHENIHVYEAPAIFVSLALGVAPVGWYARFRRHGRLAGVLAAVFMMFSFTLALLHGWMQQAEIFVFLVSVAFMLALAAWAIRIHRSSEASLREIGAAMKGTALFHDDGERIIVYPRRGQVLVRTLLLIPFALVCGFFLFVPLRGIVEYAVFFAAVYFTGVLTLLVLALLYRVLLRIPTLVIGPDGIRDSGSLFATGAGLIRWDEIFSVEPEYRNRAQHFLMIRVTDAHAIRQRLPLAKRLLRGLLAPWSLVFRIWQPLLDEPVVDLSDRIRGYVETHAPEGWLDEEEEASSSDDTARPLPSNESA